MLKLDSAKKPRTDDVQRKIEQVAEAMRAALMGIFAALPVPPTRPLDLTRQLGINKVLASRVLSSVTTADPLGTVHGMPGPEALRTLIAAARKAGVKKDLIEAADRSVAVLETLINDTAGGRAELDAMISAWLPEARRKFEASNKQAAYKAMSCLKGAAADVAVALVIQHPSQNPGGRGLSTTHADIAVIEGYEGLRKLNPYAYVLLGTRFFGQLPEDSRVSTIGDLTPEVSPSTALLNEFAAPAEPPIEITRSGNTVHYALGGESIGRDSAMSVYLQSFGHQTCRLMRNPKKRWKALSSIVGVPSRSLVFDLLLHESIWPTVSPELRIYDTTVSGHLDVNLPECEQRRLDLLETLQPLGKGVAKYRFADLPRHIELIRHVCDQRGWDCDSFRGFRCHVEYPVHGAQLTMLFEVPAQAEPESTPSVSPTGPAV